MKFVLGSSGRLGSAIVSSSQGDLVILDRQIYSHWSRQDGRQAVCRFFDGQPAGSTVYVAAGITDPRCTPEDHEAINVTLPKNIIFGATALGMRVVTFGTVMEELISDGGDNNYLKSKISFARYIREIESSNPSILHVRLHTLYGGGPPAPHMFLGQLLTAIVRNERFRMSSGNQLREYHHVDDDVLALSVLTKQRARGIVDISHGSPVKLIDLARYICDKFGRVDSIDNGALRDASLDNYDRTFSRNDLLKNCEFRDTQSGVFEYLQTVIFPNPRPERV